VTGHCFGVWQERPMRMGRHEARWVQPNTHWAEPTTHSPHVWDQGRLGHRVRVDFKRHERAAGAGGPGG